MSIIDGGVGRGVCGVRDDAIFIIDGDLLKLLEFGRDVGFFQPLDGEFLAILGSIELGFNGSHLAAESADIFKGVLIDGELCFNTPVMKAGGCVVDTCVVCGLSM